MMTVTILCENLALQDALQRVKMHALVWL